MTFVRKLENAFTDATQHVPQASHTNWRSSDCPGKTESKRIVCPRRQFQSLDKTLRKNKARPRIRQITERTRQISDKTGTESACQACARQSQHVSEQNAHQNCRGEPGSAARSREPPAAACQGAAAIRRCRDRAHGHRKTPATAQRAVSAPAPPAEQNPARRSRLTIRFEERRGAAEKTQGSGHFQQQRLGGQAADFRGEAACPAGEPGQGLLLTREVALLHTRSGRKAHASAKRSPGITPAEAAAWSATTIRSRLTMALGDGRLGKTSSGRRDRYRASQSMMPAQRALNANRQGR
jgi:hypothetical protein